MSDVEIVEEHANECCICERLIVLTSASSPHPEAPQMIQLPPGAWGRFRSRRGGTAALHNDCLR